MPAVDSSSPPWPPRAVRTLVALAGVLAILVGAFAHHFGLGDTTLGAQRFLLVAVGIAGVVAVVGTGAPGVTAWSAFYGWGVVGLLAGLIEAVHYAFLKALRGLQLHVPDAWPWMTPAAHLLLFVAVGAAVAVLLSLSRWPLRRWAVLFLPLYLAAFGQLRLVGGMHNLARMVLAAGIAWVLSRACEGRLARLRPALRGLVGVALALLLVTALAWPWAVARAERNHIALAPPPAAGAPNVLLIVLDTMRADRLGASGSERPTTPRLDQLARAGAVFERALSTSPWTLPGHATLFTGYFPHEVSVDWKRPLDGARPTLAEAFSAGGWATGGFVGNLVYTSAENGLARGFARYEDFYLDVPELLQCLALWRAFSKKPFFSTVRNDAETVVDAFLGWSEGIEDRPFFAFLNFFDPHARYVPPSVDRPFGALTKRSQGMPPESPAAGDDLADYALAYDTCVAYMDREIGRMLDALRQSGRLDNTVVVVTGDHAEMFGEHGMSQHANSVYLPVLHVPLVVSMPGRVPAGQRVAQPVSIADVPATILDLVGLSSAVAFPGHSLAAAWRPGGLTVQSPLLASVTKGVNRPEFLPIGRGGLSSIQVGELRLIVSEVDDDELYDLSTDPGELDNLAERRPRDVARLRTMLEQASAVR